MENRSLEINGDNILALKSKLYEIVNGYSLVEIKLAFKGLEQELEHYPIKIS